MKREHDVGETVGRYEILGGLATGGMGEILLARVVGPSGFERPVVLKRMLPHLARERRFVEMFLDEARIVASIRHPNVVQVNDLGHEGDALFMVMEYLEGENAEGLLKRLSSRAEALDPALACFIVAEACAGLHAAHELVSAEGKPLDLVHRDVSPQNIFVTYDGEVKLLDFGIAAIADRANRTEAGQVKGKFEYMSPEQCRAEKLDRRSDVFALGIVLYELVTGRRLFARGGVAKTIKAISSEPVVPLSRVIDDCPPDLEAACLRALSLDKADRYGTAAELRRDLVAVAQRLRRASTNAAVKGIDGLDAREELCALMRRVFPERIAEKKEMLGRVRAQGAVDRVVPGEVDVTVELPLLPEELTGAHHDVPLPAPPLGGPKVPDAGPAPRQRRAAVWIVAAASALGVGGAALGVVALVRSRAASVEDSAATATTTAAEGAGAPGEASSGPSAAAAAAEGAQPDAGGAAAAGARVTVRVDTVPTGARVMIDGADRGTTPLTIELARTSAPLHLELRHAGFAPIEQDVVPDSDQRVVVALSPLTRRAGPRPRAGGAHVHAPSSSPTPASPPPPPAPAASSSAPAAFRRFD